MRLQPNHPKSKRPDKCDRCGNVEAIYSYWFPFKEVRIWLCTICYLGLALGDYIEIRHLTENPHKLEKM